MKRLATILSLAALVLFTQVACDSLVAPATGGSSETPTIPSLTLKTPIPLPPTHVTTPGPRIIATAISQETGEPEAVGVVEYPRSAEVIQGQAYVFSLYTHCGLDQYVDFDGSFWDAAETEYRKWGNAPPGIGDPGQLGTMTLLDEDHARFEFDGGSFDFIRHDGPKAIRGCY